MTIGYRCFVCHHGSGHVERPAGAYVLMACDRCGHGQLDPLPSKSELEKLYQGEGDAMANSFPFRNLEGYLRAPDATHAFLEWRIQEVLKTSPVPPEQCSVLDVGCGSGLFLALLKRYHGFTRVAGIDIAKDAVEAGKKSLGLDLRVSDSAQSAFRDDERFDLVDMYHVLEHLHDPVEYLQSLRTRMSPDGAILIEVPNLNSWAGKRMGPFWQWLLIPEHVHYFSVASLKLTLEQAGFRNVMVRSRANSVPAAYVAELYRAIVSMAFRKGLPVLLDKPYGDLNAAKFKLVDRLGKLFTFPLYCYMTWKEAHSVLLASANA